MTYRNQIQIGFTMVELLVVIVVLGILVGLSSFGYGSWQQSIAKKAVQSDLKSVMASLESEKNFGSGYPSAIPTTFSKSDQVSTPVIKWSDSSRICVDAYSVKYSTTIQYYIDSTQGKEPKAGVCPASPIV